MPMGAPTTGFINKERWEEEAKRKLGDASTGRLVMFQVLRKEDPVDLSGGTYQKPAEPVIVNVVFLPVTDAGGNVVEPAEVFRSERVIAAGLTTPLRKAKINHDVLGRLTWFTEGKTRPHVRLQALEAGEALDEISKAYDSPEAWNEDPYTFFEGEDRASATGDDDEIPF